MFTELIFSAKENRVIRQKLILIIQRTIQRHCMNFYWTSCRYVTEYDSCFLIDYIFLNSLLAIRINLDSIS
jgi:hypothetical protein